MYKGLFIFFFFSSALFADELVQIQTVSKSGKSFVIRRGREDGVVIGQEAIFGSEKFSLQATAIEVSRENSLWQLSKKTAFVPFARQEYVIYHSSTESIWNMETPEEKDLRLMEIRELIYREKGKLKSDRHWLIRLSFSRAFAEVSSSNSTGDITRQGVQGEILFSPRISRQFEWGIGIRGDRDSIDISDPSLNYTTIRAMGVTEFTYHFAPIHQTASNGYITIGTGYGLSRTDIDLSRGEGTALSLPYIRLGLQWYKELDYAFLFEISGERVQVEEEYSPTSRLSLDFYNARASIGLKF